MRAGPFSVDAPRVTGGSWPGDWLHLAGYRGATLFVRPAAWGGGGLGVPSVKGLLPPCPPSLEVFEGAVSQEGYLVGDVWQAPLLGLLTPE